MTSPRHPAAPAPDRRPSRSGTDGCGWRRLSRRMLVVHPISALLTALPVLAAALVAGSSTGQGGWWGLLGAGITVAIGALRWVTTTYRITGQQLQVRRGLLQRRLVGVPLDRVRTVDVSASALHRVLG
ncbi:MAG TPA: PH domain-containing protein, partial [Candidatus Dormibacteraeota bacterium]